MKKVILSLTIASSMLFVACDDSKKDEEKEGKDTKEEVVEEKTLSIDTQTSYLTWKSWNSAAPEDHKHEGKVRLAEGSVTVKGEELISGKAIIDVSSIFDTDIDDETKEAYLINHLSGGDFFGIDSTGFAAPMFVMTGYADGTVTGDLTIAGKTNTISFPAAVTSNEEGITITSETFGIDMTQYGLPYFAQEKPAPKTPEEQVVILNPEVEFTLHIVAK